MSTRMRRSIAVFVVILLASAASPARAQFTGITKNPLGQNGMGFGIAWVDYDRDGDDDLFLTYDGPNVLLRNDGADAFSDVTPALLAGSENSGSGVWGDYDNDADPDLYVVNYLASNRLFRDDGASGFVDATTSPLGVVGPGQGAAWVDADRDGKLDLYVVHYGTPNKFFRNLGAGAFADATSGPLGDAGWGVAAAWGDYDNDGDPDLYLTNDGPNRLLRNDGGGGFTRILGLVIEDGGAGQGAAWGDFDNDGDLDLYVANYGTPSKLIRNDGSNVFTALTAGPLGDRGNSTGVAWGDFDNDGDLDLYRTTYGSGNKLLRNDGGGVFTAITSGALGDAFNSNGTAWADYDRDGDLDLYVVNDGHANVLLRNDLASTHHWLEIELEGSTSNRGAIGARVRVASGALRQIREVDGGSGYMSQNSRILHFGLGAGAVADTVTVRWPSGVVTRSFAVASDQRIVLREQDLVGVGESGSIPARVDLAAPAPNPAAGRAWIGFTIPRAAPVRLSIFDIQGRVVATLVDGAMAAGRHHLRWERRDARGERAPGGVYFARLETEGRAWTRKLVLLP